VFSSSFKAEFLVNIKNCNFQVKAFGKYPNAEAQTPIASGCWRVSLLASRTSTAKKYLVAAS